MSSGQGGESFIDSTTNTICTLHTIQEGSAPLFITKETREFRKPQLDSSPIQKQSPNPERRDRSVSRYACRSTERSTDPSIRSTGRSTVFNRESHHVSWSTGRSTVLLLRSTEWSIELSCALSCASLCTPVDRAVGRPLFCVHRSTGRSTGSAAV